MTILEVPKKYGEQCEVDYVSLIKKCKYCNVKPDFGYKYNELGREYVYFKCPKCEKEVKSYTAFGCFVSWNETNKLE